MFSADDLSIVYRKLRAGQILGRLNPMAWSPQARVRARWANVVEPLRHWGQIPLVQERICSRISGRADHTFRDYVTAKYLTGQSGLRALSLGCGAGAREMDWARRDCFASVRGLDLSPKMIEAAKARAKAEGLEHKVRFDVGNASDPANKNEKYDVIIFEHSLHHFTDVANALANVRKILSDDGFILVDEYIGPRRFQWTEKQIALANGLLLAIPEKYRRTPWGQIRRRNLRAGKLLMWLNDPSEAVESDIIERELRAQFRVLDYRGYGGTLSHLIFQDIAHHFAGDSPEATTWGSRILDAEDDLLRLGVIESDFGCFVCRP